MIDDPAKLRTYRGEPDTESDERDDPDVPDYVIGSAPPKEPYWRGLRLTERSAKRSANKELRP